MQRDEMLQDLAKLLKEIETLNLSPGVKADAILSFLEQKGMLPPETMRGFNTVNRWDC